MRTAAKRCFAKLLRLRFAIVGNSTNVRATGRVKSINISLSHGRARSTALLRRMGTRHVKFLDFFKICRYRSLLISRGARCKILKFRLRLFVLKFQIAPTKDNFYATGRRFEISDRTAKKQASRRLLLRKFLIPMPRVPFWNFTLRR